jgi:hypothetical protein
MHPPKLRDGSSRAHIAAVDPFTEDGFFARLAICGGGVADLTLRDAW